MSNSPFKVGDKVVFVPYNNVYTVVEVNYDYSKIKVSYTDKENIAHVVNEWFFSHRFKLVSHGDKHYFVNDNRTLMTEEEAMEYLRKNGGGTLYKKVLTMTTETKTVEKIERYE